MVGATDIQLTPNDDLLPSFLKLNWSWRGPPRTAEEFKDYFDVVPSDDEMDVFNCHLKNIDHVHLLDENIDDVFDDADDYPIDPRTNKKVEELEVDCTKKKQPIRLKLFDRFPEKSSFSKPEQIICLRALSKMNQLETLSEQERMDLNVWNSLLDKRLSEKDKFQNFVMNSSCAAVCQRIKSLEMLFHDKIVSQWKKSVDDAASDDTGFSLGTAIPLAMESKKKVDLILEQTVIESGFVPRISLKDARSSFTSHLEKINVSIKYPITTQAISNIYGAADLFLTSDVLKVLLDPNYDKIWNIEFVKTEEQKVLNRILPQRHLNGFEKCQLGMSSLVRKALLDPKSKVTYCLDRKCSLGDLYLPNQTVSENANKEIHYELCHFDDYLESFLKQRIESNEYSNNYKISRWKLIEEGHSLELLIQTTQDACDKDGSNYRFINISTKVEFKPEFGAEQMTASELISEWVDQYFNPQSVTFRIRITAEHQMVLSTALLKLNDIERDLLRLYKIGRSDLLQRLFSQLRAITNLPKNRYLIHHEPRNLKTALIYMRDMDPSKKSTLSIKKIFETISYEPSVMDKIPWIPIDDFVILPMHRQSTALPCTIISSETDQIVKSKNPISSIKPQVSQTTKANKAAKKARYKQNKINRKKAEMALQLAESKSNSGEGNHIGEISSINELESNDNPQIRINTSILNWYNPNDGNSFDVKMHKKFSENPENKKEVKKCIPPNDILEYLETLPINTSPRLKRKCVLDKQTNPKANIVFNVEEIERRKVKLKQGTSVVLVHNKKPPKLSDDEMPAKRSRKHVQLNKIVRKIKTGIQSNGKVAAKRGRPRKVII